MLYITYIYIRTHTRADELNSLTNKPPPLPPYAPIYIYIYCMHYPSRDFHDSEKSIRRWQWRCVIIITTRKATSLFSRKRFLILITTTRFNSYKYIMLYTANKGVRSMRRSRRATAATSLANRNFLNCKNTSEHFVINAFRFL